MKTNTLLNENGCHEWQGSRNGQGYGQTYVAGRGNVLAHRLAWEQENGPIPDGMVVLHRCDNPPCCNPAHLHIGTQRDNMRDKVEKGRNLKHGRFASKLTASDATEICRQVRLGIPRKEIAAQFGVTTATVGQILNGKTWAR